MNSTLIDFNTYKHSIFVMFVIGFVVGCCVGVSDGLHGVIRWYKLILRELIDLEVRIHYA